MEKFKESISYKNYKNFYDIVVGSAIFFTLSLIAWLILEGTGNQTLASGYWINIVSTVFGAVLTIFVLDQRNENRAIEQRKDELILQMGSRDHTLATEAARLLTLKGWIKDGSMKGADLMFAQLAGMDIVTVNFEAVAFGNANLESIKITFGNFKNANFNDARLNGAHLDRCNFENAIMSSVRLGGANLRGSNLKNAVLLLPASFSKETRLPDNEFWTPDTDIQKFTDPNHPNFWRSDDPKSPAYRGNSI